MLKKLRMLLQKEEGQGLVEYSLIAALVAVAVVAALTLLGGGIQNTLNTVVAALEGGPAEGPVSGPGFLLSGRVHFGNKRR